ncbi:putative protein phosphatase 1 regulatory subunit 3B-like [Penaeus vannamei]|uniref:CBM21 domain-containing protein n=1 Tax=Penaeus vannamei TaxID=6689 RepID=A0A3R7SYM3_PENVA|nr:putative protein phosphatase 1 regulatory subunit 3B-like [Penaeus vannamei]
MTTLMMPSDYGVEMYLGSSPVLTSGYLGQPFIHDYSRLPLQAAFRSGVDGGPLSASCSSEYSQGLFSRNTFRRASSRRSPPKKVVETPTLTLQPIKSCLVARQEDESPPPHRTVRLPARWTADFLEQVTGGAKAEALADQWELAFRQPASDYLGMKARLETNNVSLENVVIKESEARVTGTVKVRNLSYHKQVKVRYTTSNWLAHDDVYADYVPSAATATGASYDLYDTFTFALPLPSSNQADKLEFCVCYTCSDAEFWDNNNNLNYVLVSFRPKGAKQQEAKPRDAYQVNLDAWSEFASWNHLSVDDSPYW